MIDCPQPRITPCAVASGDDRAGCCADGYSREQIILEMRPVDLYEKKAELMLLFRVWYVMLAVCGILGCGEGALPGSTPPEKVASLIQGLNDSASSDETFQTLFVSGAVPEDRAKYFSALIEVVDVPKVHGNEATAQVKISQASIGTEGGHSKAVEVGEGTVTWKLKLEGEEWKLVEAPLP